MQLQLSNWETDETITMAGSPSDPDYKRGWIDSKNAFCVGYSGLLDVPETDTEPIERTYSDGVVFPPEIRRKGRNFTIDILITDIVKGSGLQYDIMNTYYKLTDLVVRDLISVYIENGPVSFYSSAQCQRVEVVKEDLYRKRKILLLRFYFYGDPYY